MPVNDYTSSTTLLSQTAQQILYNMDYLLEDDYYHDNDDIHLITPPRMRQRPNSYSSPTSSDEAFDLLQEKKHSPGFSTATSPTYTSMTDKSKEFSSGSNKTTEIYTCPERKEMDRMLLHGNGNTDVKNPDGRKSLANSACANPSGMVIRTQYAKEAILDPTWLDSDEEEDEDEEEDYRKTNSSLLSVTCSASHAGSANDDCARSASSAGKAWSVGTGSSLSVGSCGLGKMSLCDGSSVISFSGSEGSGIGAPYTGSGRRMLNHMDVVDMGVESVSSGVSNDYENVLDYLYDLDRRDYDLSEEEVDEEDGDENLSADEEEYDQSDRESDGAYLPPHLMSPPRLSRKMGNHDGGHSVSDDRELDNSPITVDSSIAPKESITLKEHMEPQHANGPDVEIKSTQCEGTGIVMVSPLPSPRADYEIDSASSTDETTMCSNCSPTEPTPLLDDLAGIMRGDLILSILDCPGSRTRKKRTARKLVEETRFQWGSHAVQGAISCMRSLRKNNHEVVVDQVNQSSLSPERSGRILKKLLVDVDVEFDNCRSPTTSRSLMSGSFSATNGSKSPDRSQRLERLALDYLKNDEYENALSTYLQIQSIHEEYLDSCEHGSTDRDEHESYTESIIVNIGIIHLCEGEYSKAIEYFRKAEQKCAIAVDSLQVDCIDVNILKGHAHYALGQFENALQLWKKSICQIRRSHVQKNQVMAELLNNLGCAYFETGTEIKALKCFKESLQTQKKALFDSVYDGNDPLQQHHLLRLASTRANIGYTLMRMKNTEQAIELFKDSLLDQNLCLDPHHPLVISTMENLAIALIKRGSKDSAVQVYSKMLTAKIEEHGAEHNACITILTKLSLLQLKGHEKEGVCSCIKKIQACLRNDDPCQKERFEKLLKVCKVSGLKTVTVGRKK